jgi:hypothetical protein
MSEEQTAVTPPALDPPPSCYASFHEKLVFVQLKVEMVGVTYPNTPVLDSDGNVVGTRLLRGQCIVHQGEGVIEIRTLDPLHPNLMAVVLVPKDLIAYITRIEPMH